MPTLRLLGGLCLLAILGAACATPGTDTLGKIRESGRISLGYRDSSRPFSYLGDRGQPVGYSIDLCTRVVDEVKTATGRRDLKIDWVRVTPEDRMGAVTGGRIDLECGSTTASLSRQEQVDFSYPTFVDGASLLVAADANVRTAADLAGKPIAVVPGTTTQGVLTAWLAKQGVTAQVLPVREHAEGLAAVADGRAVAYASDRTILIGLGLAYQGSRRLQVLDDFLSYEPYGLMMRRRDLDFRLTVNRALAEVYRSGEIVRIYDRWFGNWGPPSRLLGAMYLLNSVPE
ncbi:MAG TPA: amino acid ABC transporter substrate-binding protein [Methylomirabilota bacterium]|nr:amino acid ABC transporter substrate-binding protein [Methylomirabilota bacterium]